MPRFRFSKNPRVDVLSNSSLPKSRTLFPNLVELYCRDDALEEVYFFLSPSLRRVVILNDNRPQYTHLLSPSVSFFVNAMPEICPDIQSLEVYADLPISALRSVQKLKKLQYLGLNVLPPQSSNDAITGLSLLSKLQLLKLSNYPKSEPLLRKSLPPSSCPESFCTLRRLDFAASLDLIVNELPSFISPNLTSFTAEIIITWPKFHGISETRQWSELCETLMKHPRSPSSSLRTLSFTTRCGDASFIKYTEVNAFQPLLALHGLETLVLELHFYNLDDETLIK